ncbi:MAG: hypothetical protein AAF725_19110 [Acidobacteriota bacterium]
MKASALTAPLLVVGLIFVSVWALGMLAVRSSTLATDTSVELLRLHMQVVGLHETLAARSAAVVEEELQRILLSHGAQPATAPEGAAEAGSESSAAAPWPSNPWAPLSAHSSAPAASARGAVPSQKPEDR